MLDNYRDLIDELTETPTALRALLGGQPSGDVGGVPVQIDQLSRRDRAVLDRLQTMLRQRSPYLHDLETTAPPAAAEVPPLPALLDAFEHGRGELISLLMNLTLRDWERAAIDERHGEITVADEVERHVEFDEDRLQQITAAVAGTT